jgi:hypothetical protein
MSEQSSTAPLAIEAFESDRAVGFEDAKLPEQPKFKDITFRVAPDFPEHLARMAFEVGLLAIQHCNTGAMISFFPHVDKDKDGNLQATIGHFPTVLLRPEDATRMMTLAKVINEVNQKTVKARQGGPANELTATMQGTKAKDNALTDLQAQAQGRRGGIIKA